MNWLCLSVVPTALATLALLAFTQPGDEKGKAGKKGFPPFELGRVLPPFLREQLDLSDDQSRKLAELEAEVRQKLEKILTEEQVRRLKELSGKGPKGFFPGKDEKKDKGKKGKGPEGFEQVQILPARNAIQWYATWESGIREAQRSNRPIFLVSAAPHCAGISGTW